MPRPREAEPADAPEAEPLGPGVFTGFPRLRTVLSVAVGIALMVLLIRHSGVDDVHDRFDVLGARSPLVLLPFVVIAWMDARGWRCTLPGGGAYVPMRAVYMARLAGEAVNSLTPTAALGEPVKAYLLRPWGVTGSDGLASIVIAKTALTVAQSFFVVLGIAALFDRLDRGLVGGLIVALFLAACAGFAVGMVWLQQQGPATTVFGWLRRVVPRARFLARLEPRVAEIDARLVDFYRIERSGFVRAAAWNMGGWLLGVVEVQVMMALIQEPISFLDALIIEALAQPIRALSIVIPGGIGTQEVGGVALCTFLGMPEPIAVTLWLLKRGRELVFDGVGLAYLAFRSARRE